MAKRQKLKIKVVDHRYPEDHDKRETVERFTDHKAYLRRMREISGRNGMDVSEQTASLVHLYPKSQNAFNL